MRIHIILWLICLVFFDRANAQLSEPYQLLHGGNCSGLRIPVSPDPIINYHWKNPAAADSLEIYTLKPAKTSFTPAGSFQQNNLQITVKGEGAIVLDFGVESAGWLEFESADLSGDVEAAISEYNEPAIVNDGAQHPVKIMRPVKYGNVYRLQLNDQLYEGVRFAWIFVKKITKTWHLKNIRLVCQSKPVNYQGSFSCNDSMLNRIWYTGAYVVKLNMLQDYFGAILMERSDRHSWTGDAYPAQAAALAAFGNYDVIKKNIAFTAGQDNGIAAYSVYWVLSLVDYYNYTGDTVFLEKYMANASRRLQKAYTQYDTLPSLGFMGWDERLGAGFENTQVTEAQNTYRMLCINAWKQFSVAMLSINQHELSQTYRQYAQSKINQLRANNMMPAFGVHAVSEAINAGLLKESSIAVLADQRYADRLNRLSYSPFNQYFIIEAMALAGKYDEALTTIRDCWGGQIKYGGTSFFEVYRPSWNEILKSNDAPPNNQCGYTSLAHPWGAGVTKWLSENILGIQPVTPGFKKFNVIPHLSAGLTQVKGVMPTPFGAIDIAFDTKTGLCSLSIPEGTMAEKIGIPTAGRGIKNIVINNKLYSGEREEDKDFVYLHHVKAGKYNLKITYSGNANPVILPLREFSYPVESFHQDSITGGNWKRHYGTDGFLLFGYEKTAGGEALPAYIAEIKTKLNGSVTWDSASTDSRVLESPGTGKKIAAAIITRDPLATLQTMTIDISMKENHPYQLSLYFLDKDKKDRRSAIEIFDLATLDIIAPVQMVRSYENGKYISFSFDKPVRIRINQVRGLNAALCGLFFDKQ